MAKKKACFIDDEGNAYICYGYKTKASALKAIHKMEREDCGLENEEDLMRGDWLKKVKMSYYKKDGEDWYNWSGDKKCEHCGRDYPEPETGFIVIV